jgi:hypothetical protein
MAINPAPPNDVIQLPLRGEKRFAPFSVDVNSLNKTIGTPDNSVESGDFLVTAAKKSFFSDYIKVRIPHRGVDSNGKSSTSLDAIYHFLINPATLNVTRQTVDAQAFTRGGWQFGVWGEDVVTISMTGQSAGQYFTLGLTDEFQPYAKSYRNLQQLVIFYENNGYWFEGEEANEGPLAPGFTRRRIKSHQDVELTVGNSVWSGMFDTLTVSQDATRPFVVNFTISFVAWKERFLTSSPYKNTIMNGVQRGHFYQVPPTTPPVPPSIPPTPVATSQPPSNVNSSSTAVQVAAAGNSNTLGNYGAGTLGDYETNPLITPFDSGGS